ncbi:hypothetical protein ACFRAR_17855 [Kitasatospora sp. NPDC056651]|uniref:hypothetical protein n=1 Tax=Kitasatospora sp. NPDC056651 TaxID=3345892 RepID=UPI003693612C
MTGSRTRRPAALASAATAAALVLGAAPTATAAPAAPSTSTSTSLPAPRFLPTPPNTAYSLVWGLSRDGSVIGEYHPNVPGQSAPHAIRWHPDHLGYTTLAALPGDLSAHPSGINDTGTVIGASSRSLADNHPIRWAPDGTPTPLPLPAGVLGGNAQGINNAGVVVGGAYDYAYRSMPVKWQPDGTRVDLPPLPGDDAGDAVSVSDAGVIAGTSERRLADGHYKETPVLWSPSGAVSALPLPPGVDGARVVRMSHNGVVLGQGRRVGDGEYEFDRVLVWTPDGAVRDAGYGRARAVNSAGTAVGAAFDANRSTFAARWNRHGAQTLLDGPAGRQSEAMAVNSTGTAVGDVQGPDWNRTTALLWRPDGTAVPLPPSPLSPYAHASFINDAGVVAGIAVELDAAGEPVAARPVVWTR